MFLLPILGLQVFKPFFKPNFNVSNRKITSLDLLYWLPVLNKKPLGMKLARNVASRKML